VTTRHGKPRKDFRTGREKVERYVRDLLLPIAQGGFAQADGWVDVAALRLTVKTLGKRPVSEEYLQNVIRENSDWELSQDGTKARALRFGNQEARYATPAEVMYAGTTMRGSEELQKLAYFDAEVSALPPLESDVVLKIHARRAETLGAKFYATKLGPGRLRAKAIPLSCVAVMRDRGIL
jgi:RNA:NAD 2'-phosphotransferase (TPT1/KptA family)